MGSSASQISNNSLKSVEWSWQSNAHPFLKSEAATWEHYSDLENLIIERALKDKQLRACLDDYYIDFESNLQISSTDDRKQRPIKRVIRKRKDEHLREVRFMDSSTEHLFRGKYGWVSLFIIEVRRYLKLKPDDLPSKKSNLIPILVEKAANGIVDEGIKIGKKYEALELANTLREQKKMGMEEVWKCCAYLYSLESFLYKNLHEAMTLVGDAKKEQVWRSKIHTLGPFCLLLWDDPLNTKLTTGKTLYRAAHLKPEEINEYEKKAKKGKYCGSFQAYTSCSRNREKVEELGNTLFIMEVFIAFVADLSQLSEYWKEEEELVVPGVCFRVEKVESDIKRNKHLIYLQLRQRFLSGEAAKKSLKSKDPYDSRDTANIMAHYINADYAGGTPANNDGGTPANNDGATPANNAGSTRTSAARSDIHVDGSRTINADYADDTLANNDGATPANNAGSTRTSAARNDIHVDGCRTINADYAGGTPTNNSGGTPANNVDGTRACAARIDIHVDRRRIINTASFYDRDGNGNGT